MKRLNLKRMTKGQAAQEMIKTLRMDGLVVFPTETCYGIGARAVSQKAVNKLLEYKERPEGKAISIAVCDKKMAAVYVKLNETAKNLYRNFLPGPLTVISKSRGLVARGLEAEDGSLGIRVPDYTLILEIIRLLDEPITATSANVSGKKTPYSVEDILKNTSPKQRGLIDLILDAGALPKNPPSTVVDTRLNEAAVIRKGEIEIQGKKGGLLIKASRTAEETQKIAQNLIKRQLPKLKTSCLIFALQGELGAGKTQFAKGAAKGLGIRENVVSPTFVMAREYKFGRRILFHVDTWRMRTAKELEDLGFEKMLKPGNVIAIEWPEKVRDLLERVEKRKEVEVVWVLIEYKARSRRGLTILTRQEIIV